MFKKLSYFLSLSLGMLLVVPISYGQQSSTTTTTTTEQQTTIKTPVKKPAAKPAAPAAVDTTTLKSTTTTTEVKPPPPKEVVRTVYDEETLKKMSDTLCTDGFKAYVGTEKKNVCMSRATTPDIAYSCVWDKDGTAAFAPTPKGPCNLDYVEHRGNVVIKKENFPDDPPLSYGKTAECCFRAAKGLETSAR